MLTGSHPNYMVSCLRGVFVVIVNTVTIFLNTWNKTVEHAPHALFGLEKTGQTDGRTDGRQNITLCLPLDSASEKKRINPSTGPFNYCLICVWTYLSVYKVGRVALQNVIIELFMSKCVPVLHYGSECCPVSKSQLNSLEFALCI